jgi:hypothetical protein
MCILGEATFRLLRVCPVGSQEMSLKHNCLEWIHDNAVRLRSALRSRENRRLRIVIYISALVVFAVSLLILRGIYCRGVQYGSHQQTTQFLLEATPRGTARPIVRAFVDANGWGRGGLVRSTGGPDEDPADRISVYLGEARCLIVNERVYAEWVFNAEDKLVDVRVYKIALVP